MARKQFFLDRKNVMKMCEQYGCFAGSMLIIKNNDASHEQHLIVSLKQYSAHRFMFITKNMTPGRRRFGRTSSLAFNTHAADALWFGGSAKRFEKWISASFVGGNPNAKLTPDQWTKVIPDAEIKTLKSWK